MSTVHHHRFWRHLTRVPVLGAALMLTIICAGVGPSFPPAAQADTFSDPGFTAEVVTTLPPFLPVGVTWASDGRLFIWQRNGVIRLYKNGQLLATPFLDISASVNGFDDRGMMGLALHPNFLANGYVYVSYVREEGGNPNDASPKIARLSRFTVDPQTPDVALATSETILLSIPNLAHNHTIGTLRFGPDGKLFVGHGDDSNSGFTDVHSFVAQDLTDPRGKILRLNEDGTAPGDNPFDDGTNSIQSKVYAYGLRNPFRFTLHPVSGEPYWGDVGWNAWEAFGRGRGKNFGWPCYEGGNPQPNFQTTFSAQCAPVTTAVVSAPLLAYPHPGTPPAAGAPIIGACTIGGPFYTATLYPEVYRGNWFNMDYTQGWILRLVFDGAGNLTSTLPFATGLSGPVDLEVGPDGMLYYVSIVTGQVKRIRYNGPSAVAAATPSSGYSPLSVNFSSAGSSDPNGSPLTYLWDFGDGQTSTLANPVHAYASATVQPFTATVTVTNTTSQRATATVRVTVGSLPPTATIQSPLNGTSVLPGQTIAYQGFATDPEDGVMPSTGLSWIVLLHHNDHTHTQLFTTGPTGSVVIQNHGIGTYSYEFRLTATDSSGLTQTTSIILPVPPDTTPPTNPSGLVATAAGRVQVNLTWTASTDQGGSAVTYRVERCQGAGCANFTQIATPTTNSYGDPGLTASTSYSYRVRALDNAGNLSANYSNGASTTTAGPTTGLVAAYAFNEGTGTVTGDTSGNANTGTLTNGPTWDPIGKYGTAVSFDGVNDHILVPASASLNLTTAMTLEAWVNPSVTLSSWKAILQKETDAYFLAASSNQNRPAGAATLNGTCCPAAYAITSLIPNTWTHVATTYDGTQLRMYINGIELSSMPATGSIQTTTTPLRIGGNTYATEFFQGLIDEVRIYNRTLTTAEILADMTTPITPPGSDTTPPSDVTGLTATAISATQITLSWTTATDNVGVTGYRVERCQGAGCTSFVPIATAESTTFGDTSLTAATNYSYRVKAVDAATNVSVNYSNGATATTQAAGPDTIPPTDPTGLTATAAGSSQINLTWTASTDSGGSGLTGYRVERCQGTGCTTFSQIATPSTNSYSDPSLTAGTRYRYRIRAMDGAGNSSVDYSNTAAATPPVDTTAPTDPTNLTATAASSSQINLIWTASTDRGGSGLAGYRIKRCQGPGCTTFVQIATTSTNSYNDPGLTAGIRYSYRVRAVDGVGNQSLNNSNTAAATLPLTTAYGMNEGSGTTLTDASGNGHTGTLVDGPAWVVGQATYGQALSFDGLDDAILVANPATYNFGTADFTLEIWVKRSALGGAPRHLFSKCAAATWLLGCKQLYFNRSNQLVFGSFATGNTLSSTIADTNWHHVAVSFTNSTNALRIYVDGALVTTATKALEADGAGHVVTVGNRFGRNTFSGLLDEVRIYNRVLTLTEIQADRTIPIVP